MFGVLRKNVPPWADEIGLDLFGFNTMESTIIVSFFFYCSVKPSMLHK